MSLEPGRHHPYPAMPLPALAERFGLQAEQAQAYLDAGMPGSHEHCDPFAAYNWLCWQRLSAVPILQRRWRMWQRCFEPHLAGHRETRHIRWQRRHHLYLPHAVTDLRWAIPAIETHPSQQCLSQHAPNTLTSDRATASGLVPVGRWRRHGVAWRLDQGQASTGLGCEQQLELMLSSQHPLRSDSAVHRELLTLLEPLAAGFRYGYRQHQLEDDLPKARQRYPNGSCLDCALLAGDLLMSAGWRSRLVAGVLAMSAIANPHYWLEVEHDDGWIPVDVSMAAMAQMLGLDWRPWLSAWIGACDARRVRIAAGTGGFTGLPGCHFISCAPGAVVTATASGWQPAWACIDWVCGDCSDTFETL